MKENVKRIVFRVVFAASVSICFIVFAVEEARNGALPREWLPEVIFAVLFPLALFVGVVEIWVQGEEYSDAESNTWNWLRIGIYGGWSLVGVGFLVLGSSELVVLALTIAGSIGVATTLSHRYRSSKSADT